MRDADLRLLQGFPIFRPLTPEAFMRLVNKGELTSCKVGSTLVREGELPENLFVLIDGLFETYSEHGKTGTTLSFIRPPTAFILAAVLLQQPYLVSVRALTPSRVLTLPIEAFHEALADNLDFCRSASFELATRYRDTVKELKNLKTRTAIERLANWIVSESNFSDRTDWVYINIAKAKLASRLGMTNEHLSRAFLQLRSHGIMITGRNIQISDRNALEKFACPDPLIDGIDT